MTELNTEVPCPECGDEGPHQVHSSGARQRLSCSSCHKTFSYNLGLAAIRAKEFEADRVVITCYVKGALVHLDFLRALENFCSEKKATLLVVPIRYKNPTTRAEDDNQKKKTSRAGNAEWIHPAVQPYLIANRAELHPKCLLMGDIHIQPTAERPLRGMLTLGAGRSVIYAHPKVALETITGQSGIAAQVALTTGAVSRSDFYSDSKAGAKAKFHHVYGAVYFERDGAEFHVRHVLGNKDGSFYDLNQKYGTDYTRPTRARVLTAGDLHAERTDATNFSATFSAPDSLLATTRPEYVVLHDVLDFEAQSHHNTFIKQMRLRRQNRHLVKGGIQAACDALDTIVESAPADCAIVIVPSNHHEHLDRWLESMRGARDQDNWQFYFNTMSAYADAVVAGEEFDPLQYWAEKLMKHYDRVLWLKRGDTFSIDGVERGHHGDKGPNGARGSSQAFTVMGARMTIGHGHGPNIKDGVMQVGTSSALDMEYNRGASNWAHAHELSYPNGKRTLVFIRGGKYRAV